MMNSTTATARETSLKSVLAKFEKTIDENNHVGVNSGMYLTTSTKYTAVSLPSVRHNRGRYNSHASDKEKKTKSSGRTTNLVLDFDQNCESQHRRGSNTSMATRVTEVSDCDDISRKSFTSGSRRASTVITRNLSVDSEEGSICSSVLRASAQIRELPREVLIGMNDDDSDDSDDDDDDMSCSGPVSLRHW
jgi:hypothetical protein